MTFHNKLSHHCVSAGVKGHIERCLMNYLTPRAANVHVHEDMKASLAFYFWICVCVGVDFTLLSLHQVAH